MINSNTMKKFILYFLLALPVCLNAQIVNIISCAAPVSLTPTWTGSPLSIIGLTSVSGSQGGPLTYTVFGTNLFGNVATITAPAGFLISKDNITYSGSVNITPTAGTINQLIYVVLASANTPATYTGNITNADGGALVAPFNVALNGVTGVSASMGVSPTTFTGVNSVAGSAGGTHTFVVTWTGTTPIVTPFTPIEVSQDGGSTYSTSPINLLSGSPKTVTFRNAASASPGAVSGNIGVSGTGVTTVNVGVTGLVSSGSLNDTINIKPWDSIGHSAVAAGGKYTDPTTNFWAPDNALTASLTTPNLFYTTGVLSPITVSVDVINDFAGSVAGYGAGNTMGYATNVFGVAMYNSASMTLTFHGLTPGNYKVDIVSSTGAGAGPHYIESFSSGAQTQSGIDAFGNTLLAGLVQLSPLTPTSGNIAVVITPSNSFTVITHIRIIRLN